VLYIYIDKRLYDKNDRRKINEIRRSNDDMQGPWRQQQTADSTDADSGRKVRLQYSRCV